MNLFFKTIIIDHISERSNLKYKSEASGFQYINKISQMFEKFTIKVNIASDIHVVPNLHAK